jgi:hypothetical protein
MSTGKAPQTLRLMGRDFWGAHYIAPMAAAMRTDGYSLKRWCRGRSPAKLTDRLAKLADSMLLKYVGLAIAAAEWRVRIRAQSDIVDVALVGRLRDIRRELASVPRAPAAEPPVVYIEEEDAGPAPNLTIDQLCAGMPDWQQRQLRELDARPF